MPAVTTLIELRLTLVEVDRLFLDACGLSRPGMDFGEESPEPFIELAKYARLNHSVQALGEVYGYLSANPEFVRGEGLVALQSLLISLSDHIAGRAAPLLASGKGVSGGFVSNEVRLMRACVVLAVHVMRASGVKPTPAAKIVADLFAGAGYTGRKGGPLTATTVSSWVTDVSSQGLQSSYWQFVSSHLVKFKASGDWPPTQGRAKEWVTELARNEMIRPKI